MEAATEDPDQVWNAATNTLLNQDIPAMLRYIEQQAAEIARLRAQPTVAWDAWEELNARYQTVSAEHEQMEAEVERLEARLRAQADGRDYATEIRLAQMDADALSTKLDLIACRLTQQPEEE